ERFAGFAASEEGGEGGRVDWGGKISQQCVWRGAEGMRQQQPGIEARRFDTGQAEPVGGVIECLLDGLGQGGRSRAGQAVALAARFA
ncbi:MAG TPA: hypothetical protein VKT26_01935, partial [Acetobacteraceae bacterium]|nr:hypothetical protein [Acetobacteraceae bacterium]